MFKARRLPSREEVDPQDWALAHTVNEGVTVTDELLEIDAFDGVTRTILNFTAPVLDDNGQITAAVVVNHDISELIESERRLRESEARARSYIEHSPYGVFVADAEGRYVEVNPAACRITGYSRDELLQMSIPDVVADGYVDQGREHFERLLELGHSSGELMYQPRNGPPRHWSVNAVSIPGNRFVGFVDDITDRKRADEEFQQLQRQLNQTQRMEAIGRLAGGVAHDFNNLLTVITGNTELALLQVQSDPDMQEVLHEVSGAAARAAELTGQLLAFGRRQIIEPDLVPPARIVRELERMLRRLIGEDIVVEFHVSEETSTVEVDPGQIERVLVNLALNARDAMPRGGRLTFELSDVVLPSRGATQHTGASRERYVRIRVSDTGEGMSPDITSRIFEPFFTTKGGDRGTGLGLSIALGIVEQHGGFIEVESVLGRGSTFCVFLPCADETAFVAAKRRSLAASARGCETILIVEDEPSVRSVAVRILERHVYEIRQAKSGAEALGLLDRPDAPAFALLLTDVVMPGMNGPELADAVRKKQPGVRVLFTSGYADELIADGGELESGVNFLRKPYGPKELLNKVRAVLDT